MLLKLFKSNHPFVLFLIPLLAGILWLPSFNTSWGHTIFDFSDSQTFIYSWLYGMLGKHINLWHFLGLTLCVIQSYIIIRLNFKFIFLENRTYLPAVLFIIFCSFLGTYQTLHPALISTTFMLLALNKALDVYSERKLIKHYFEAGFLLGLGGLFYAQSIYWLLFIWLSLIILNGFNLRAIASSIIGYLAPLALSATILFLTDNIAEVGIYINEQLLNRTLFDTYSESLILGAGILAFLFIYIMFFNVRIAGTKKISTRKHLIFFYLMVFVLVLLFIFNSTVGLETLPALSFPLAIIFTTFFMENRRKWVNELIFTIIILITVYNVWF